MGKEERKLHLVQRQSDQGLLNKASTQDNSSGDAEDDEYTKLDQLERLESIREDMEEFGISTLGEVIERIADLNQKLDN